MRFFKKPTKAPATSGEEGEIGYRERLQSAARALRDNLAWTDMVCPAMDAAVSALEAEILDNDRLSAAEKENLIAARLEVKRAWTTALAKLSKTAG